MSSQIFQGLSFVEVVERLQEDESFSNRFEALALSAAVTGSLDSPDGEELLRVFAKDEQELSQLLAHREILEGVLSVNRRETIDTGTPGIGTTPGITTTPTTVQCAAVGRANVAEKIESNKNESPQ